jgi:hypothetical protein
MGLPVLVVEASLEPFHDPCKARDRLSDYCVNVSLYRVDDRGMDYRVRKDARPVHASRH